MKKKDKEEILELFGEAFREVMLPSLEDLHEEIQEVKHSLNQKIDTQVASKKDIDRLERKQNARENQLDRFGNKIDNHEKRITRLEKKPKLLN